MFRKFSSHFVVSTLLFAVLFCMVWTSAQAAAGWGKDRGRKTGTALLDRQRMDRLRNAIDVHERHKNNLMAIFDVVAGGVGLTPDGEPCIKVFTAHQNASGIPDVLEGVRLHKEISSRFYALQGPTCDASGDQTCDNSERWPLPVPIGISVGHPDITAGTIGARVTDGANVFLLSNNHVLADNNSANLGDYIVQPGIFDGGFNPDDAIATLADFAPILPCTQIATQLFCDQNTIDAAIALTTPGELGVATPRGEFGSDSGYGAPSSMLHPAYGVPDSLGDEDLAQLLGAAVMKYGRTTGLTTGVVDTINATINVCYDSACENIALFTDQLIVTPGTFSAGGDSGSLVVDSRRLPVGLLFAGSSTFTAANRIDLVLNRFGVGIDDQESLNGTSIWTGRTANEITDQWYPVNFQETAVAEPVILACLQTFDGSDTAGLRMRNIETGGFEIKIEEEQSRDTEKSHTTEIAGYLALEPGSILDAFGSVIGESGTISSAQSGGDQWRTVTLQGAYASPVVLMNITTFNGGQPSHIRLRNVKSNSFEYQIEEWDYLDQSHTTEGIGYVVLKSGIHSLHDGRELEVGVFQANHLWHDVFFSSNFNSTPVMLSQCQTAYGGQAVVTRQRNGTSSSFQVRLQEEEGNDGIHLIEMVGYAAIETP